MDGSMSDRKAVEKLHTKLLAGLLVMDKSSFKGNKKFRQYP